MVALITLTIDLNNGLTMRFRVRFGYFCNACRSYEISGREIYRFGTHLCGTRWSLLFKWNRWLYRHLSERMVNHNPRLWLMVWNESVFGWKDVIWSVLKHVQITVWTRFNQLVWLKRLNPGSVMSNRVLHFNHQMFMTFKFKLIEE